MFSSLNFFPPVVNESACLTAFYLLATDIGGGEIYIYKIRIKKKNLGWKKYKTTHAINSQIQGKGVSMGVGLGKDSGRASTIYKFFLNRGGTPISFLHSFPSSSFLSFLQSLTSSSPSATISQKPSFQTLSLSPVPPQGVLAPEGSCRSCSATVEGP